ncbi:MAG: hypothetical protein MUC99_01795 [Anaerolineae bacterium]|nr:hypothetical protein [Anaerolineae bacterium]
MHDTFRQGAVLLLALSNIVSSFWLGNSLDQGTDPTPVYFLPFGLTFAIWGVIFASQLAYGVYQVLPSQRQRPIHRQIGGWVALNAGLTTLWNLTAGAAGQEGTAGFQPLLVGVTVFILMVMLFALTRVFMVFHALPQRPTRRDHGLILFPFTVFFAWLNVAMIANTTAALDAFGFRGDPDGALWAVGMLAVAAILASVMIAYTRQVGVALTYTAVIVWALVGIFINNLDRSFLVSTACVVVALIVVVAAWLHLSRGLHGRVQAGA